MGIIIYKKNSKKPDQQTHLWSDGGGAYLGVKKSKRRREGIFLNQESDNTGKSRRKHPAT